MHLRWTDIDLDEGVLVVREGKGGRARAVPIHPALVAELQRSTHQSANNAVAGRADGKPVAEIVIRCFGVSFTHGE